MELNENIKSLRLGMGLNQVEFAKKIGVTKQCVSNWENDNVVPSIEMLCRLADFFATTTDYLLGRTPNATLSADGLTAAEISHIRALICDLTQLKQK